MTFYISNGFGQSINISDLRFGSAGQIADPAIIPNSNGEENCFEAQWNYRFTYIGNDSPPPAFFNLKEMEVEGVVLGGELDVENSEASILYPEIEFEQDPVNPNGFKFFIDFTNNPIQIQFSDILFSVFTKAKPGEELEIDLSSVKVRLTGGSGALIALMENPGSNNNQIADDLIYEKGFSASCMNAMVSIDFENITSGGGVQVYEVQLTPTTAINVSEFDLYLEIIDEHDNIPEIDVQPDASSPIFADPVKVRNGNVYSVFFHYEGSSSAISTPVTAFSISIEPPPVGNAGGDVSVNLLWSRLNYEDPSTSTPECCQPELSDPLNINFAGETMCSDNITLTLNPPNQDNHFCSTTLIFEVFLGTGEESEAFDYLELELEIESDIPIDDLASMASIELPCPDVQGGANNCPLGNNCWELTVQPSGASTLLFQFCDASPPLTIGGNNDFEGFEIHFDASTSQGCINRISFATARLRLAGSSTFCVPNYVANDILFEGPYCMGDTEISGSIITEDFIIVDNVAVSLEPNVPNPDCRFEAISDCVEYSKCFTCDDENVISYTVTPALDIDDLNGVSTFDLVLMRKHILFVESLNSPYKIIAVDVNASGTVTTFDMVELQKLILFIHPSLPENTSWRFVDRSYVFPNPSNPFLPVFPKNIVVDIIANPSGVSDAKFYGIKVGDVNNSVTLDCGGDDNIVLDDEVVVSIPDVTFQSGETKTLSFAVDGFDNLVAWQMGIHFDPDYLQLEEVLSGDLAGVSETNNFGLTKLGEGELRGLWVEDNLVPKTLTSGQKVFELKFTALQAINDLSTVLGLRDNILESYAWELDGTVHPFTVQIGNGSENLIIPTDGFSANDVIHNELQVLVKPNPFTDKTEMTVIAEASQSAQLLLYDVMGRLLQAKELDLVKGSNQIEIEQLNTTGIISYVLQTKSGRTVGKLLKE